MRGASAKSKLRGADFTNADLQQGWLANVCTDLKIAELTLSGATGVDKGGPGPQWPGKKDFFC